LVSSMREHFRPFVWHRGWCLATARPWTKTESVKDRVISGVCRTFGSIYGLFVIEWRRGRRTYKGQAETRTGMWFHVGGPFA